MVWFLSLTFCCVVRFAQGENLFIHHALTILNLTPNDFSVVDKQLIPQANPNYPQSILVNFHSSSCGHCISHAPIFTEFARILSSQSSAMCAAVDCDEYRDLCTLYHVDFTPSFRLFVQGQFLVDAVVDGESIAHLISAANRYFGLKLEVHEPKSLPGHGTRVPSLRSRQLNQNSYSPKFRILNDASRSLRYGLEKGVFLGRFELNPLEYDALLKWLEVLSVHFPTASGKWRIRKLLLQVKSQPIPLTSQVFDSLLANWGFGKSSEWMHCRNQGDISEGSGYTCGLWVLFHMLSVQPDNEFHHLPLSTALHGFVQHFFSCQDCRDNFLLHNPQAYVPVSSQDFSLWLWREHTYVNHRLNAEQGEETHFVQFPEKQACPSCYNDVNAPRDDMIARYLQASFGGFPQEVELAHIESTNVENPSESGTNSSYQDVLVLVAMACMGFGVGMYCKRKSKSTRETV